MIFAIAIGVMDWLLPANLVILYLGPIYIGAWYGSRAIGTVVAIYSGTAVFLLTTIEHLQRFEPFVIDDVVSLVIRLVVYTVVSNTFAKLHSVLRQQKQLSEFIVHDLRSPISSSITGLQTLETMDDNLDELQREMVQLALVSNQRALTLVNSILDVSKLENGNMEIHREEVESQLFVSECFEQVALWANGTGIQLQSEISVPSMKLDPILTSRVIVNLLSNALKFSPPETTVTVKVIAEKGQWRFSVSDHGAGIPAQYVQAIFEPFEQVKGTKGGTGLGLTFCRLAVEAQGGRIWAESTLGKGTTMVFTLPQVH